MKDFPIARGAKVDYQGQRFEICHLLADCRTVVARNLATNQEESLDIADLQPPASEKPAAAPVLDLTEQEEHDRAEARRWLAIIKPLLDVPRRPRAMVVAAAQQAGVEASTLYRRMRVYRDHGTLSALLPTKRNGGRGKHRLNTPADKIIDAVIEGYYLKKQQPTIRATADEVARLCRQAGIQAPALNTVRSRIQAVDERKRLTQRGHSKVVKDRFTARPGTFTDPDRPYSVIQLDHTKLAIMVVDEEQRRSVGRPYLTLAMDVSSRMIAGFYLSLDPSGSLSTGLCLAHSILPKETWLAKRGITTEWPCWGFPARVHLDNAKEFRGEMIRRACEEYGIEIDHRPVAVPHFGAHIERTMKTLENALRRLPGTTLSNPSERGEYDSEAMATMTLGELEAWIAEWITGVYHQRIHKGMDQTPIAYWKAAILGDRQRLGSGIPARPSDEDRLRLDFMPFVERTIQNYGIQIDEIHYYSDVFRPHIAPPSSGRRRAFIFRRDPRDISTVYFWEPALKRYFAIPYRDVSRPVMSLWELRAVRRHLEEQGRAHVDEEAIFAAYKRLHERQERAARATKVSRRNSERKRTSARVPKPLVAPAPPTIFLPAPVDVPAFDIDDL